MDWLFEQWILKSRENCNAMQLSKVICKRFLKMSNSQNLQESISKMLGCEICSEKVARFYTRWDIGKIYK